jgi:hypothetical protein
MFVRCAEGVIHRLGKTVLRLSGQSVYHWRVNKLGKRMFYKRSVMIALAMVALMTLTAGVAAAAPAMKATDISASGLVGGVGLPEGGMVGSTFATDSEGAITSVKIHTQGEAFGGGIFATGCDDTGKHNAGACTSVFGELGISPTSPTFISSVHNSTATLSDVESGFYMAPAPVLGGFYPIPVIRGSLSGSLNASLTVNSSTNGDELTGKARMQIESDSTDYACLTALGFAPITACMAAPGMNEIGVDPVLIPVDLEVTDTGTFHVRSRTANISGDIEVTVVSVLTFNEFTFEPEPVTGGSIVITDAEAIIFN